MARPPSEQDFYSILSIPHTASPVEIKRAYHRTLLLSHPDKTSSRHGPASLLGTQTPTADIALIKEAYTTLSTPHLRAQYDRDFSYPQQRCAWGNAGGPRPAQVISLEDFVMQTGVEIEGVDTIWSCTCRCGGTYKISSDEMEQGNHLVGCTGCSEVVWVGYELADDGTTADAIDDGIN